MLASLHVLNEAAHVEADAVVYALAALSIICDFKPVWQSKVHCLCYVKAIVKAGVVARASRDHEFTLSVNSFGHSETIINHDSWVYKSSFVPDKLWTFFCLVWKLRDKELLKYWITVDINSVPKLWSAMVQIVD